MKFTYIIIALAFLSLWYAVVQSSKVSKEYWINVGPSMDKALNPNKS